MRHDGESDPRVATIVNLAGDEWQVRLLQEDGVTPLGDLPTREQWLTQHLQERRERFLQEHGFSGASPTANIPANILREADRIAFTPHSLIEIVDEDLGEKTQADMLREWGSFLPRAEQKPGSREQVILHMEQQMTAAISDLLRTMDWAKVSAICKAVESDPTAGKRVRSTAGAKRPFAGAAGGPTGAPGRPEGRQARQDKPCRSGPAAEGNGCS